MDGSLLDFCMLMFGLLAVIACIALFIECIVMLLKGEFILLMCRRRESKFWHERSQKYSIYAYKWDPGSIKVSQRFSMFLDKWFANAMARIGYFWIILISFSFVCSLELLRHPSLVRYLFEFIPWVCGVLIFICSLPLAFARYFPLDWALKINPMLVYTYYKLEGVRMSISRSEDYRTDFVVGTSREMVRILCDSIYDDVQMESSAFTLWFYHKVADGALEVIQPQEKDGVRFYEVPMKALSTLRMLSMDERQVLDHCTIPTAHRVIAL